MKTEAVVILVLAALFVLMIGEPDLLDVIIANIGGGVQGSAPICE